MSWQDFFLKFAENNGGLVTVLLLMLTALIWIGYSLLKKHVVPKMTKIFDTVEELQRSVINLNAAIEAHKKETELLKHELDMIHKMYTEQFTETKIIILELKETVHDLVKFVNKISVEHTINHQERMRKNK